MGQGVITSDEIVQRNLLQPTIDQYTKLIVEIEKANVELNKNAKAFSDVATAANIKSKKSLNDLAAAYAKAKNAVEQSIKNDKDKIEVTDRLNKTRLDAIKLKEADEKLAQAELRTAALKAAAAKREAADKERANKAAEKAKQLILDESNAYKKLTNETNKAQAEFKQLAAQHGVNSRQAKAARDKFEQLDNALRKVNNAARDGRRDVGRYGEAWNAAQSTLSKFGVGISIGFAAREGLQVLVDYEDAVAKFRTIVSDLSDTEFAKYQNEITNVANTTKLSTTEIASSFETIAGLNAEFAKTSEGIGNVSEAVATLAKASKGELQPTAENLVGIMNQFDLAANQADRTINVLAAGQAVGAASIQQSSEAYKNFGSVAKGANIDLEKSQALIQTVAKFSIFGAEAGTKLRGVTLKLQQANLGYQSGIFNINDALKEYNEKLAAKTTAQDKDALASDVFGAENITVGKILASNIPLIEKFEKGVTGTSEAQKAAAINSDTLSNRWEELKDSATTLLTTNENVGGSLNVLKNGLKFVAENLGTIVSVIGKAIKAFVIFKGVMMTMNLADQTRKWYAHSKAVRENAKAAGEASEGTKKFSQTLKGIGWTAFISLAAAAAQEIYDIVSGMAAARFQMEEFAKAEERAGETLENIRKKLSASRQKEMNQIAKDRADRKIDAIEEQKRIKAVLTNEKAVIKSKLTKARAIYETVNATKLEMAAEIARDKAALGNAVFVSPDAYKAIKLRELELAKLNATQRQAGTIIKGLKEDYNSLDQSIIDTGISVAELSNETEISTGAVKTHVKEIKEETKTYKDLTDAINAAGDAENERIELIEDFNISGAEKSTESAIEQAKKAAAETGAIEDGRIAAALKREEELKRAQIERIFLVRVEEAVNAEQVELALEQRNQALQLLDEDMIDKKKQALDELTQLQEGFRVDEVEVETEKYEELYNAYKNFQEALTEVLKDQIDARIAQEKKLEDAAKGRQDFYEELAAQGIVTADQSITKQIELQEAAQREQERLEATKQRVEAISAGLKTYTALLEEGKTPTQALTGAVTTTEVLASILKNIPFFADGTDNAPEGWAVVDEKGAELITDKKGNPKELGTNKGARFAYLNQGDMVKTAPETAKSLLNRFDQIEMGRIVNNQKDTAGNSFDLLPIQNELKGIRADLTRTQTKYEANWEGLAKVIPYFTVIKTKGGDKFTDRHYVE